MTNLILFGPPGSGKGTQADKLKEKYDLLHISTGDLFRFNMKNDTPLGQKAKSYISKGELVPDSVTIDMLRSRVEETPDVQGYIFDGFPRNINQSEHLDKILEKRGSSVTGLLMLEVAEEEIVKRILNRGKTSGRADDNDEGIIRNRFKIYQEETTPVFDYYDKQGKSHKIDGQGSIEEVFERLCTVIDSLKK